MEEEAISLIGSNSYGDPDADSPLGHFVRVTSNTHPTPVNQLAEGGRYPHADCADACADSLLLDHGIRDSVLGIEVDLKTNEIGTQLSSLVTGLQRLLPGGWAVTLVQGTPTRNTVMNPLGGRIVSPLGWAPYGHASKGWYVSIVAPAAVPVRQSSVVTVASEDEPMPKVVTTSRAAGVTPDPNGAGAVYLVANWPYGPKRHINAQAGAAVGAYLAACGQSAVETVDPYLLDRIEDGPEIKNDYVNQPGEQTSTSPIPAPE